VGEILFGPNAQYPGPTLEGGVVTDTAALTFSAPATGLIEGMQVTGPGLDNPDSTKGQGGVTILAIAADKKSVTLSQLARHTHPLSEHQMFTFVKPQPLPVPPPGLLELDFSEDPKEDARVPLEFAKKVYQVMAAMAQIPKNPDPHVTTPHVIELMNNVVGGNMGFIFDTNARRFSDDGLEGFGLSFLEAASHGLPCIAGRSGGVPEAVEEGQSGVLISPEDSEAFVRAATRLLADPAERSRMSREALRWAASHPWERSAACLRSLLGGA